MTRQGYLHFGKKERKEVRKLWDKAHKYKGHCGKIAEFMTKKFSTSENPIICTRKQVIGVLYLLGLYEVGAYKVNPKEEKRKRWKK